MVLCMGQSINVLPAVAIGALSVFIKGGTFLFQAVWGLGCGQSVPPLHVRVREVTGITFALLRRFREFVWIALGAGRCLAMMTKVPILPLHKNNLPFHRDLCQAETEWHSEFPTAQFQWKMWPGGPPRLH